MSTHLRRQDITSCPPGQQWYRCAKGPFKGCCETDPCNTGICTGNETGPKISTTTTDSSSLLLLPTRSRPQSSSVSSSTSSTRSSSDSATTTRSVSTLSTEVTSVDASTTSVQTETQTLIPITTEPPVETKSSEPTPASSNSNAGRLAAIITPTVVVSLLLLVFALWCFRRRRRRRARQVQEQGPLYDASVKPSRIRNSVLGPALGFIKAEKWMSSERVLARGSEGDYNKKESVLLPEENASSPGPSGISTSPVSPLPEYQSSPHVSSQGTGALAPMELLGSLPRIPPIELDSTNGSPIAELSASPISPSQRNPNIHPDTGLTPGLSGDGGLSITTPEGVILKPNLTSDCAQGYQPGPADHVTSFMDFQTNETSPKGT